MVELVLVVAVAETGVIGDGEAIPWTYPEDHAQYTERVRGHPVVVGRRTFEQMGRLEGTHAVVLTNSPPSVTPNRVTYVTSVAEAAAAVADRDDRGYVIGGQGVYSTFLPYADRALVSEIPEVSTGSHVFPYLGRRWEQAETTAYDTFTLVEYTNRSPTPIDVDA